MHFITNSRMFDIVGKQERVAVFCFWVFRITMYVVMHAQLGWTTGVKKIILFEIFKKFKIKK